MDILNYCILSDCGHYLTVPKTSEYSLSASEYAEFKSQMLNIKGEWIGKQQFYFPFDASAIIERIKQGESIDLRKLQLFPTSPWISEAMYNALIYTLGFDWKQAHNVRVLEPGAGTGNIINFLRTRGFSNIDYCEICPEYDYMIQAAINKQVPISVYSETHKETIQKVGTDFLKFKPEEKYDIVFANPPFKSDLKHLLKMIECVKEGGYVCTLLGEGFYDKAEANEDFLHKYSANATNLYMTKFERVHSKDKEDWHFESTNAGFSMLCFQVPISEKALIPPPVNKGKPKRKKKETSLTLF